MAHPQLRVRCRRKHDEDGLFYIGHRRRVHLFTTPAGPAQADRRAPLAMLLMIPVLRILQGSGTRGGACGKELELKQTSSCCGAPPLLRRCLLLCDGDALLCESLILCYFV